MLIVLTGHGKPSLKKTNAGTGRWILFSSLNVVYKLGGNSLHIFLPTRFIEIRIKLEVGSNLHNLEVHCIFNDSIETW